MMSYRLETLPVPAGMAPFYARVRVQRPFRGESAARVPGVEYEAFEVVSLHVGSMLAWDQPFRPGMPATELLNKWAAPMHVAAGGIDITIAVRNKEAVAKRFAIFLVGQELR